MGSTFNPQILVDKLSKLNSTQQSIETLSHWCIFHMNKAKQVVETWDRQFYCAPREQRLAFLYLANDILQNSRRKGAEFVAEFWKVLPDSLRDVIQNGDEAERNAALRLINIWEERKVFGSRGQILKEEFVKRQPENGNKNWQHEGMKLRSPGGIVLDKLISGYQAVYGHQLEDDALFNKCADAITFFKKVDKDIEGDYRIDELKEQHAVLRDCIEQLAVVESSRANLISLLQEALQDQEFKLGKVRDQLQAAQTHSEQAGGICRQVLNGNNGNGRVHNENKETGNQPSQMLPKFITGTGEQSTTAVYARQESSYIDEDPKSAAAAMAAKLAASTSSAQMLTFVLSSLASEGVIGNNPTKESSGEYPSEKRVRIENEHLSYVPPKITQAPGHQPLPSFQDTAKLQHNTIATSQELNPSEVLPPPPPPLSSPRNLQPLQPPMVQCPVGQYLQSSIPLYGYGMRQQQLAAGQVHGNYAPVTTVSDLSAVSNGSYTAQTPEGGLYGQAMAHTSNQ